MANGEQIQRMEQFCEELVDIEYELKKLLRPELGELGLQSDFESDFRKILKMAEFASTNIADVHHEQAQDILNQFEQIIAQLKEQSERSNQDYVAYREEFLDSIGYLLEELRKCRGPLLWSAIESRGLLEDEGLKREYEKTIASIKEESESALNQVRNEAEKTIEEARVLSEQIEKRARSTAARISVEEAQDQFQEAQSALDKRVKSWAWLGGISVLLFFVVAGCFLAIDLSDQSGWHVAYYSAIRVSVLAALGTVAAFCFKTLRAHMHMSEKNRHRQRVANSIGAFVESAVTPEQRDMILSQMVESVVMFGNSGLINRDEDNMYRPKMTVDAITRTLFRNPPKE